MIKSQISKERKRELEQPDPFLESLHKGLETAREYKKQLLLAGGTIVAIVCIVSVTVYSIRSSETKASEMLSNAMESYQALEPSEGYEAVKENFNTLLKEYPNTSSSQIGKIRFAEICYSAGEYDTAFDLYKSALNEYKEDSVIHDLLLLSLAHTCQAQKKNQDAEKYFTALAGKDSVLMKDDALFNLGMLAITSGDQAKGIEFMKKITSEHETSMYKSMAETIVAQN